LKVFGYPIILYNFKGLVRKEDDEVLFAIAEELGKIRYNISREFLFTME